MPSDSAGTPLGKAREGLPRILIISYEYPPLGGGLGKAVRETALQLEKLGYEIAILTSGFGELPSEEFDGSLFIVRIPVLRRHAKHARMMDVLSFGISGVLFSKRRLRGAHPDLILAYLTVPSGIVGAWLSFRYASPLLTLLRGTDVPGHRELKPWMHTVAGPLMRLIWRRSLHVISNSEAMARQAEQAVRGLTVETVHNGVDLDRYRPVPPVTQASRPIHVLYTGRIVRVKRLETLLRVWAEVQRETRIPAVLELAGFGPEREALEKIAVELGLDDTIRFLGSLSEDEMVRAYQRASIFVSYSWDEGLPNSVLEAMACGLPVVLSDIGPHREILDNLGGGILCDTQDPGSLRIALLDILQDAEKRELMGKAARASVEKRFSWMRTARELNALFPTFR